MMINDLTYLGQIDFSTTSLWTDLFSTAGRLARFDDCMYQEF